ncbi:ANK_REP_REGION domain-containing protein [Trichonephila clavata]|uniref:ANK_REP_REGION domain-containing protein n=1 Tax=Trichonephila clavata TaxID=2740835 RepID=A0A8X6IGH8_TRICU|nr:ANK_REP_REGION domain-containing protein [Trichonephila clavata]
MTFTRIVRLLWSGCDVQKSMAKYFLEGNQTLEKWISIEEILKLKISNCLFLPKELRAVLSSLVKPIGIRIRHIIVCLYSNDYLPSHFMSILSWTLLGTIDAKKTAETVLKDDNLPIDKRYEIACTYCLEDEILMLWKELPETNENDYLNLRGPIYALRYFPIYWTYYMRVELNRLDRKIREEYHLRTNCYCIGTLHACITFNQSGVEYFVGKMSVEEKERYFQSYFLTMECRVRTDSLGVHSNFSCDIIYFLLSQMNENQRTSVFEKYSYDILKNFLKFPYGGIFLQVERSISKYLTVDQMKALKKQYKKKSKYFFKTFDRN